MTRTQWLARTLALVSIAGAVGACDFVKSTTVNPNAVPTASVDQLFVANQANEFFFAENNVARMVSIWMQQMAGTDRQFSALDVYQLQETDADGEFTSLYTGGGLVDLRKAQATAEKNGWKTYDGILKINEAYLMGTAASVWGDIPYSEALNPGKPAHLDKQEVVYAALQARLDTAISELTAGGGLSPGGNDLVFGGDASKWIAAAHTLKARLYMHWAKAEKLGPSAAAQTACGGDCIQKALAETASGIQNPADNWTTIHTTAQTESNVWYQFMNDRSGYISAGAYLDSLLVARQDPRLTIYYSPNSKGVFVGSHPGENLGDASGLSTDPNGFGLPDHSSIIVGCAENAFIAAEANYYLGNTSAAQSELQAGVACQNALYGVTIPVPSGLSGGALLTEIMTQKYIAQFLNEDVWEDYKRTCVPALDTSAPGKPMPRRLLYGIGERQTNPNIPDPAHQPARNTNDPAGCLS